MPRKRKIGDGMPTTKLNEFINQLTDAEFADFLDLDGDGNKEFAWRKLVIWHRGKSPYDPAEEKVVFKEYEVYSLRKQAAQKVESGMKELRLGLPRKLVALQGKVATFTPSELELALAIVAELKARANLRGYFQSLKKILTFEKRVVFLLYEGKKLRSEARRVKAEKAQAKANIVIEKEIAFYHSEYLESVVSEFHKKGVIDQGKVAEYNSSDFARLDVSAYPDRLACPKLLIDEFFSGRAGETIAACKVAESILLRNSKTSALSPSEHSKLLTRLATYYSELGEIEKAKKVIVDFEGIGPEKNEHQKIYLRKYLLSLFQVAFDANEISFGSKAVEVFERNETRILDSEHDIGRFKLLIYLLTYFLGIGEGAKAKRIFNLIYKMKDQKPSLQYRFQYRISHLMILFELKDYEQMQSFGKNYKEYFKESTKENPVFAEPACDVLDFLRGQIRKPKEKEPTYRKALILAANRDKTFNAEIDALLAKLEAYSTKEETRLALWYGPLMLWLESKKLKLV